ncbi:hypothetical protein [Leptolyngbya phage Lbo-JY12]
MSEPLIGNKPNDNKIDVPSIKVKEPTSQAEFTAILEEASKAYAKPVQQKPTTEPVRTPVTTDSGSIDVPPVVPSSDVPSDVIDSIAGQREPGTYSPLVAPGEPLPQERPTLRLPVYPQQDFNTPSADVQPYQGQQVYSTADPLVFGNTVSDERFNHWVSEAQKQATQMRPTDMLSQAFRVPQLDPSVSGGFAPTSQNQPWWGSPEQTEGYYDKQTGRWVQLKRNDFNIFKGKFGEFGQGLIGGGMQLLNIPQAVVQGGLADAANVFGALGSGLDKSGGLFGAIMNPGKFAQAVGQTWQQNSPVAQGQAPLTDANPSGFFQQLRNNSYTVAGLSGRNTTGTNSRRDASGRVEPFGQLYEKPSTLALPGREKETTTLGLGITQGTNVRRERNTVDEIAIRAATALVPGISEAERQRRQQDYLSKDYQLGGVFRGLGVDIVTGGLGEKLLGGLVQGATRQTTRQAVREVVVTRKPLPEVPKLPPGRTAALTRRLPPAQGINNPAYQLPPANRGLRQASEVLEVKPAEPRVIVTPPSGRDEFGRIIADDKPVVQQPDRLVKPYKQELPGTPERPALPETTQPRPSVEPEPPIYVVSGDGSVQGTFRDGKPYRPIDLGEATFDKVNTTVRIRPEDVPTVEVEALTVPYTELPPSAFTVSDTRVFKRRVSRPDAVEVQATDITGELRPKLEGTDPNAPRLNPSPDEELKIPFQAYDKQGVPLPELQRTPEQIINGMVDGVDSLFKEYEDVLKRAEDQRLLSPAREFTTADLTRKALPEGTSPKLLDELNAPGTPLPTLKAREPLPDLRKLDKASEDIIDQMAKGLVSLDDGLKKLNELDKAKETTDLLRQAGYVQTEPGVIQSQAAQVNQKVRKVVRATDKETPVVSPLLKAPDVLKVVDAEVFSPQYSLADFAKLVTREQAGAVYNPNAMKRGERTVASLIEVGKRITLPDGTTLLPGDTKPSTVNTFAKLNRKIERALESAGVPMQDRTYYRQIFSRNGIPIPENLPDDLIIRVGKAKPDGTPETLAVSPKPKQDVTPTLPLSEDYGVAVMMTYRDGKLVPTDRQPMKVIPAVGERNWKPWVYQKDLPVELVSKSPEGLDLTVKRAEVETNIAQLADEYQAAKVNLEAVSKELNNALTKLDKVPDAGGRTLLESVEPTRTLFDQVFGVDSSYLYGRYSKRVQQEFDTFGDKLGDMSLQDLELLNTYVSNPEFYKGFNDVLRTGSITDTTASRFQKMIEYKLEREVPPEMTKRFERAIPYYYQRLEQAMLRLPTYEGKVYRGIVVDDLDSFLSTYRKGEPVTLPGITSSSVHKKHASGFSKPSKKELVVRQGDKPVVYEINSKTGRAYPDTRGEGEVLFPHNSTFMVDDVKTVNDVTTIKLTELGSKPEFTPQEQAAGSATNWLVDDVNDGSPMFHGTRVNDLDLAKADPVKGASRSELGTAIYLTKNVDEATAKATADVNRHLPMLSGRSFGDGVVHEARIKPTAVIIKDTHLLDDDMKRIFLDAVESTYGFEYPKVVRALDKALNKEGVTIKQAYALLDKAVLKFTGDVVEKELLTTQRDIVSQLRMYGIDGVSSADTVAIYNPDVIKTVARTGIGEVEDTLEHAVARLNVDSLAASRNPESPFLKASHAESKVRMLSELQEVAERELKQAQERLVDEVNKLADIDNELEGLSLSERNKLRQEALDADKRTYESFKRELNKPNDTNCL